jgi:hypothetical protein
MSSGKDSSLEAASKTADGGTATTCPLKPSSTMLPIRTAKQSTKPVEPKRSAADSRQEPSNNLSTVKYMRIFDIYKKLGIGKYIDLPQVFSYTQNLLESLLIYSSLYLLVPNNVESQALLKI